MMRPQRREKLFTASLSVLALVAGYGLFDRIRFEVELVRLQQLCAQTGVGARLADIEQQARAQGLRHAVAQAADAKLGSFLVLSAEHAQGWVCEFGLRDSAIDVVGIFGSDHGARSSWLQR